MDPAGDERAGRDEAARKLVEIHVKWQLRHRRRLRNWIIRTTLGIAISLWLAWKFPWGKWVLCAYPLLALLSLGALLMADRLIRRKLREVSGTAPESGDR
jgi:hypothetical protein